jgi:hypothetical protein
VAVLRFLLIVGIVAAAFAAPFYPYFDLPGPAIIAVAGAIVAILIAILVVLPLVAVLSNVLVAVVLASAMMLAESLVHSIGPSKPVIVVGAFWFGLWGGVIFVRLLIQVLTTLWRGNADHLRNDIQSAQIWKALWRGDVGSAEALSAELSARLEADLERSRRSPTPHAFTPPPNTAGM